MPHTFMELLWIVGGIACLAYTAAELGAATMRSRSRPAFQVVDANGRDLDIVVELPRRSL